MNVPPCRACGGAKPATCHIHPAGAPPWKMPSPAPVADPATDTKEKDLLLALQAAKATGVQQAIDALQQQLDTHRTACEAKQPVEYRLAQARALSTKLHSQRQSMAEELQAIETRMATLRKDLAAKDIEWRAAQAQVAELAQKQMPATPDPAATDPATAPPPAPPADSVHLAELRAMLAAQADKIPVELRELLQKHQQQASTASSSEAPKREFEPAHEDHALPPSE